MICCRIRRNRDGELRPFAIGLIDTIKFDPISPAAEDTNSWHPRRILMRMKKVMHNQTRPAPNSAIFVYEISRWNSTLRVGTAAFF